MFKKLAYAGMVTMTVISAIVVSATTALASSCVTSATDGHCSYPGYAQVTGNSDDPYVDNNMWGPVPGETQTLTANSPGDWKVTNSTPANSDGVTVFPNTGAAYNEKPVSSFPSIVSSHSAVIPHNTHSQGWAAYDLWFNNWANEVMIQHDFTLGASPSDFDCSYVAVQEFGGSNGVPVRTWGLCDFGDELVWKLAPAGTKVGGVATMNEPSGSVDVKQMITWLETNGHLPSNSTITNLSYGFEILTTGGVPEDWSVTSYSMLAGNGSVTPPPASWKFPAPTGLKVSSITRTGYALNWNAVTGPNGQVPTSYTVATYLNGSLVDEFTPHKLSALEYGRNGAGLLPGHTYQTVVWANGGPVAPTGSKVTVVLPSALGLTLKP